MKSTSEVLKTEPTKLKIRLNRLEWVEYELKIHVYSEPSEWPYLVKRAVQVFSLTCFSEQPVGFK